MNIICIIPARGGSKGVKNKNIKPLCGKPLIQHTIEFAVNSNLFSEVIISSDSKIINDFSSQFDVSIIPRPNSLAEDKSLIISAIRYTINEYEKLSKTKVDFIFLLEPTSPIRFISDFNLAIEYLKNGADSVASFTTIDPPPSRIWKIKNEKVNPFLETANPFLPRQSHEEGYILTGQIYGFSRSLVMELQDNVLGPKLKPIIVKDGLFIDIDNEIDFYVAESKFKFLKNEKY